MTITPETLREEADNLQRALDVAAEQEAVLTRLKADFSLSVALCTLINNLAAAVQGQQVFPTTDFAKYKKQLTPMATAYGYKLVLVGDKTTATLVRA